MHIEGTSTVAHRGLSEAAAKRQRERQYRNAGLRFEAGDLCLVHLQPEVAPAAAAGAASDSGAHELHLVRGGAYVITDSRWGIGRIKACQEQEPRYNIHWLGNAAAGGLNCPYAAYRLLDAADGTEYVQDLSTNSLLDKIPSEAWRGAPDVHDEDVVAAGLQLSEKFLKSFAENYQSIRFTYLDGAARKKLVASRLKQDRAQQRRVPGRSNDGGGTRPGSGSGSSDVSSGSDSGEEVEEEHQRRPKRAAAAKPLRSKHQRWEESQDNMNAEAAAKGEAYKGKRQKQR